jgi:hypothetical protein
MVDSLDPESQREIKNALSQIQVLYAQAADQGEGGAPEGGAEPGGASADPGPGAGGQPPPRLWTPGSD